MSSDKKYSWYKIADSVAEIRLNASGMAEMEAGEKICIALHREQVLRARPNVRMPEGPFQPDLSIHWEISFVPCTGTNSACPGAIMYPGRLLSQNLPRRGSLGRCFVGIEAGGLLNWLK